MSRIRIINPVTIALTLLLGGLLLGSLLRGKMAVDAGRTQMNEDELRRTAQALREYQQQFRALPGDDPQIGKVSYMQHAISCAPPSSKCMPGNGIIDGNWNDASTASESYLAWQHLRLAGLLDGATDPAAPTYAPRNNEGGRIGITSQQDSPIAGLRGAQIICSDRIKGLIAKKIDADLDDGDTANGKIRVTQAGTVQGGTALATDALADGGRYLVCMGS
jgi:hypothetical protein